MENFRSITLTLTPSRSTDCYRQFHQWARDPDQALIGFGDANRDQPAHRQARLGLETYLALAGLNSILSNGTAD